MESFRELVVPRVILEGVTKFFDGPRGEAACALSDLNLSIEERECLVLVGPSGSGKTTALRLIAGLEAPTSGTISIGGKSMNGVLPKDRDIAMVFQNPALYPHLSVFENLGFGLRLRRWPRREADARIKEVADMFGLSVSLDSLPMMLSSGQRQRVAIGRAVARRSSVLLLDEPLANVDPPLRAQMRTEIASLRERFGTTMIHVTHDHLEAMIVGDRVAVLHQGALQQVAAPLSLYQRPANLFVAGFVGSPPMNLFPGTLSHRANDLLFTPSRPTLESVSTTRETFEVRSDSNGAPALKAWSGKLIVLGVRAENIRCIPFITDEVRAFSFKANITAVESTGSDTYLRANYFGNSFVVRALPGLAAGVGSECAFELDTREACYFDPTTGKAII
jgi:multiple sugar transport system ATP-binding protein